MPIETQRLNFIMLLTLHFIVPLISGSYPNSANNAKILTTMVELSCMEGHCTHLPKSQWSQSLCQSPTSFMSGLPLYDLSSPASKHLFTLAATESTANPNTPTTLIGAFNPSARLISTITMSQTVPGPTAYATGTTTVGIAASAMAKGTNDEKNHTINHLMLPLHYLCLPPATPVCRNYTTDQLNLCSLCWCLCPVTQDCTKWCLLGLSLQSSLQLL